MISQAEVPFEQREWQTDCRIPVINESEIYLFAATLQASTTETERMREFLAPDELAKAERFRFYQDYNRYVLGRGFLRILLARLLDMLPKDIQFVYGEHGKPELCPTLNKINLFFNLAHSEYVALYGFRKGKRIGVDVEKLEMDLDWQLISREVFSPGERKQIIKLSPEPHMQRKAFFNCWTRKEAFIKAEGAGMCIALDSFEVSVDPGIVSGQIVMGQNIEPGTQWFYTTIGSIHGYAASVAYSDCLEKIKMYHFQL